MSKELVICSNRHETKVAILEDDQLVEVYFQSADEYSLAGSIHKGRVTRVLPGMQSAFVDLGLERDTFLYVSDFFEESEEYDRLGGEREGAGRKVGRKEGQWMAAGQGMAAGRNGQPRAARNASRGLKGTGRRGTGPRGTGLPIGPSSALSSPPRRRRHSRQPV